MRMQFFGDSYDVVKRFLLRTLDPGAEWIAFPMFTHDVSSGQLGEFESFIGVRNVDAYAVPAPRPGCFSVAGDHPRVFLDPDTGVRLEPRGGKASTQYVFAEELAELCAARPERLVVVFDQSYSRGNGIPIRAQLERKLAFFAGLGIKSFAYTSHASFLVLSASPTVLAQAYSRLEGSHMPADRLVWAPGV